MIHDYHCPTCGHTTERITSDYELKEIRCTECGKKARKIPAASANMNKQWARECRNVK